MAEIKNSFLRSKMNKDLDDRLIPNGEYRDAQNISVGKSEDDDIGALETVLGNTEKTFTITPALPSDIQTIGYLTDEYSQTIFIFATNYTDVDPTSNPTFAPSGNRCIIYSWTPSNSNTAKVIADGVFLNFSTTNPIQASLIEQLLFFTDNRNQPRKVNINQSSGYYTDEVQISVAKYNPYTPISLLKKTTGVVKASPAPTTTSISINAITTGVTNAAITASKEVILTTTNFFITKDMFIGGVGIVGHCKITQVRIQDSNTIINFTTNQTIGSGITLSFYPPVLIGMSVVSTNSTGSSTGKILPSNFITVSAINNDVITLSSAVTLPVAGDRFTFLMSTMTNESSSATWPGDPDYLESRYVRFSYRYRFDDGEYSIFAPFTQIAYIPKQKGYFKNGDEDEAFRSTIVAWMENNVNNIELLITLPDNKSTLSTSFKIASLDILYKESDQTVVKVLETIPISTINAESVNNLYTYEYQSRKPYKTLPADQTTRVYDKVPVRALSQETAGNRIIYGNFKDTYTAPDNINYDVKIVDKGDSVISDSWVEYPNHSLKQNRNYQVGFILCDKFGRQTPVILSPVQQTIINTFLGSTIFNSYNESAQDILSWFGNTLQLNVTNPIISGTNSLPNFSNGEPGLYAQEKGSGFDMSVLTNINTPVTIPVLNEAGYEYEFTVTGSVSNIPTVGEYLRGEFVDYVEIVEIDATATPDYKIYTKKPINNNLYSVSTESPDTKYSYTLNPTGWYSYKIVVKQTEQDYYNTYLPGILSGYPDNAGVTDAIPFPTNEDGKTANIVLINDNINKIPRDLSEVGPDQKQFRSSVQLFGRVFNNSATTNIQYYPGVSTDTAISISTANDSNMAFDLLSAIGQPNLYQIDTNPLIARLATNKNNIIGDVTATMRPFLAIYETEPVDSLLDIFWETGTVGLLSDLNIDIITGFDGPTSFTATNIELLESDASGHYITDPFFPQSNTGAAFDAANPTTATMSVVSVRSGDVSSQFELVQDPVLKSYRIKILQEFVYLDDSITQDIFTFSIQITSATDPKVFDPSLTLTLSVNLSNAAPSFDESPLPTIQATVDQTGNPFTGQDTLSKNGSASSTRNTEQLKWSIVSGNPTGANGQPSFVIDTTNGNLSQTANNTPSGQHTLVLKIEDANGDTADGALSATINQIIIIGPQPANSGIKSTCITGPINTNLPGIPITNTLITKRQASAGITGVWYLSDNTLTASDFTSIVVPSTPQTGDASLTNTLFKIGSALTQGTMSLSMNASLTWSTSGPAGLDADVTWRVWHRSNSSSAWAAIADINNFTINNSTGTPSQGVIKVDLTTSATGTFGTFYDQRVLAYNQPGEYAIAAIDAKSVTAPTQAETMACWVNSNDLYYSTCVIENGSNTTGGTAQSYRYSIENTGSNSYYCPNAISGLPYGYSHVPYGQYVTQFYTDSTLSTVFSFADAGSGVSNYKGFITSGSSPYNNGGTVKYKFSTRFNVSDAKVYEPNPWTQCYVEACSSANGCSPNIYLYPFAP